MVDVKRIQSTVQALLHKDFYVTIENGSAFTFHFLVSSFYHLFGFQYLIDMPDISNTKRKDEVVKRFLRGQIKLEVLQKSAFFAKIERRLSCFPLLESMLIHEKCEIIVDFDPSLVNSTLIKSKYLLYKTEDYDTYCMFGIAFSPAGTYYPETFFVEPSRYYITGQTLLECKIKCIDAKKIPR